MKAGSGGWKSKSHPVGSRDKAHVRSLHGGAPEAEAYLLMNAYMTNVDVPEKEN